MGIVRGLKGLNEAVESSATREGGEGGKGQWLKVADGKSVKLEFLQELDADSASYDEEAGTGFIATEHSHPKHYQRKGLCSHDDQGRCFGCEKNRSAPKTGWNIKRRLYINVLVDDGTNDPYVAIMSQGLGDKAATPQIIEYANEVGSITGVVWSLKRKGSTKDNTSYTITPLPPTAKRLVKPADAELFDLEKICVRDVPYAEQEAFYMGDDAGNAEVASSTSSNEEW